MRLRHPSNRPIHLSTGVTVRPAADLPGLLATLDHHAAVRDRLGADLLGVSLRFTPEYAARLAVDARARVRIRTELHARGLEVNTLDGVSARPPADGQAPESRDEPDWTTTARLEYTLDLARVLVDLLPEDAVRGSVSTLPLGRAGTWTDAHDTAVTRILGRLSAGLAEIAWQTGRAVRVGFQPEPGHVIDSAARAVTALARTDRDRLGVCLDLANLACAWEDPAEALDQLAAAGIAVVRVQVTAALEATDPVAAAGTLRGYVEPRHQHQTITPSGAYADDLSQALGELPPGPWRVRYPVPLHTAPAAPLRATTGVWRSALHALLSGPVPACDHFCADTESWDVLPPGERPGNLVEAVAAEFAYLRDDLVGLGLRPPVCA